jgi:cell division protein YceG involved in septum cleavage
MVMKLVNSAEGLSGMVKVEEFAEGSLFPDKYFYEWGEHRLRVMELNWNGVE